MDDPHGATRHLIAREVLLELVRSTARFNSEIVKWDDDGNSPCVLARMAWRFADEFVKESQRSPEERGVVKLGPTTEEGI